MSNFLDKETIFFEAPLTLKSRVLILVAVVVLLATFFFPLWNMTFYSNQYTDGLVRLEDICRRHTRDFSEFTWVPLVVGLLMILALRAMVIGKMSNLVDVFVMFTYFGLFSMWSFYHRLYMYAHNLDPTASIKVPPFTPPFFGTKQIANFTVHSFPGLGSYPLVAFAVLLLLAIYLSRKGIKEGAHEAAST